MVDPTQPRPLADSFQEPGVVEKDLPNWESFHVELENLRTKYGKANSPLLFRGHSDSTFRLTTTLERAGCESMSFDEYYRLAVTRVRPALETFTGVRWDVPDYNFLIQKSFYDIDAIWNFPGVDLYRYLVYLRHHGFPSPLLDWSRSPYVAAFFAFRDPVSKSRGESPEKRSIYVYCETPRGSKGGVAGAPTMRPIGPYVRSHPRHFRQQSDYTICGAFDGEWRFHPHEEVFGSRGARQDVLWKFNLPSSESARVLRILNEYNLNAFSLYDSEEALLETMWFQEHVLRS